MHTSQSVHCMYASHTHSYSYTHIIHKHFSRANVGEQVFLSSTLYLEYFLILSLFSSMFSFLSLLLNLNIIYIYIHTYMHARTQIYTQIHKHTRTHACILFLSFSLFHAPSFSHFRFNQRLYHTCHIIFSLLAMSFFSSSSACAPKSRDFLRSYDRKCIFAPP